MAKCVCSEAEVECKCGCGCICVHGPEGTDPDCFTFCFKCDDPKTGTVGLHGTVLGFDAWIDRRARRRKLDGRTKISIRVREAPLGSLAMALEKIAGIKLAVPTSRLSAKRTVSLSGRVDDVARRLGMIRLDQRGRALR